MHLPPVRTLLLAIATTLSLVCAIPGTGTAATTEPIVVDELPQGPPPEYSYVDAGTLVTPHHGTMTLPEGFGYELHKSRTGWLGEVRRSTDRATSLALLRPDGTQRLVVPPPPRRRFYAVMVSSDGRLVAVRTGLGGLKVYRIRDGSLVARLHVDQSVRPLAVRPGRVLVLRGPTQDDREHESLVWWDIAGRDKGALHTIFRGRLDDILGVPSTEVDVSADQFVRYTRRANVVRPLDGDGPTWKVPRSEWVGRWSPDDRLVLSGAQDATDPQTSIVRVRNHRTGAVVARFKGLLGTPMWETNDTLLLAAYTHLEPGGEGGWEPAGQETIRCRVSAQTCEKVLPSGKEVSFVVRKSS
jgi:hypothetical protein